MKTTLIFLFLIFSILGYAQTPLKVTQPIRYYNNATFDKSPSVPEGVVDAAAVNLLQMNNRIAGYFQNSDTISFIQLVSDLDKIPVDSVAAGRKGEMRFTANGLYLCVATNTWIQFSPGVWNAPDTFLVESLSETFYDSDLLLCANTAFNQAVGQTFYGKARNLTRAKFYLKRNGNPNGTAVAKLYAVTGTFGTNAKPTGAALATSETYDMTQLNTTFKLVTFSFSGANRYEMTLGTPYAIVIEYSAGSPSNYLVVGLDGTSSTYIGNECEYSNSAWGGAPWDLIFYVYGI